MDTEERPDRGSPSVYRGKRQSRVRPLQERRQVAHSYRRSQQLRKQCLGRIPGILRNFQVPGHYRHQDAFRQKCRCRALPQCPQTWRKGKQHSERSRDGIAACIPLFRRPSFRPGRVRQGYKPASCGIAELRSPAKLQVHKRAPEDTLRGQST